MKKLFIISILAGLLLPAFVLASDYTRNCDVSGWYSCSGEDGERECPEDCMMTGTCQASCPSALENSYFEGDNCNPNSLCPCAENLCVEQEATDCVITSGSCNYACDSGYHYETPNCVADPTGIFTITPTNISDITDYIQELFAGSGIYPLVALIIGLPLAFWSIEKIIDLKDKKERKKRKLEMLKEFKTKKADWL